MGNKIKLLQWNDDTLVFERAFIGEDREGGFIPLCSFSGVICELAFDKPSALEAGFAACWPLDASLCENWPISVTVQKETADGMCYTEEIAGCSGNPRAIAAVKRFISLLEAGDAKAGISL